MADGSLATLKDKVSEAEWKTRIELAALYRLVALHGWDEAIFTHISARVPGEENRFLINPYGMFFDEIRASDLVKVDLEGGIVQETQAFINPAGFTIHSAIHAARDDAHWVMHLHTTQGTAVAAQKEGLLALTQTGMVVRPQVSYHDYEGIALHLDERERLVADLGDKALMILRNHGTLAVGATPGECWMGMFYLERACEAQVKALSGGRDGVLIAPQGAQDEVQAQAAAVPWVANLAWPGWLRRLDRLSPGYDA
ncbi:MAG TPA: class II aldolase/adducin family protein [Caulobacteraceae bacterium]|jgi:ribulose-5-phosphate 4-epimerase/fuculose-1-phosphate aldolase